MPLLVAGVFSNIKGLTYYRNAADDPYVTFKEVRAARACPACQPARVRSLDADPSFAPCVRSPCPQNEADLEREELEVLPTDNLVITAKTEDDVSQLEAHVYDENEENLYVHHDLMLPSFPLCLEWLDFPPGYNPDAPASADGSAAGPSKTHGSYIAVGTFEPEIEIWSLDTVDGLYPDALLGRPDKSAAHVPTPSGTGKKKKRVLKERATSAEYHVDAVLGLAWNRSHRSLLASASADKTVKLWDLSRPSTSPAVRSFDVHTDKVQAVEWSAVEPTVLLTGSYDRTVRMWDTRTPKAGVGAILGSDVEAVRWDPFEGHGFYVSLESGLVLNFDARTLSSSAQLKNPVNATPARFTLAAHEGAASSLDVSPHVRGCLATGGTDKMVKVWNVDEDDPTKRKVSLVTSRDVGVGKVFALAFSPDTPLTLAAAGSQAKLQIWDLAVNAGVRKAFGPRLRQAGREFRERKENSSSGGVIGIADDDEDSDEDMQE